MNPVKETHRCILLYVFTWRHTDVIIPSLSLTTDCTEAQGHTYRGSCMTSHQGSHTQTWSVPGGRVHTCMHTQKKKNIQTLTLKNKNVLNACWNINRSIHIQKICVYMFLYKPQGYGDNLYTHPAPHEPLSSPFYSEFLTREKENCLLSREGAQTLDLNNERNFYSDRDFNYYVRSQGRDCRYHDDHDDRREYLPHVLSTWP